MFILGIAISLAGILFTMYAKGLPLTVFVNPSMLVMLAAPILAVLTATRSFGIFWRGLKAAASPKAEISEEERGQAASLLRLLSKTMVIASIILVVIGIMSALSHLESVYFLSEAAAAAFSGLVMGLFTVIAIFEPAIMILKKRQTSARKPKAQD